MKSTVHAVRDNLRMFSTSLCGQRGDKQEKTFAWRMSDMGVLREKGRGGDRQSCGGGGGRKTWQNSML